MQLKEQFKGSKNWKLITGVATAATLGFGAIAVAAPRSGDVPQTIDLNDRAPIVDDSFTPNPGSFVPFDASVDDTQDDTANDSISVQASADATASVDDTPDNSISPQDDSPQDDSISVDDSLDASPQASIDDSPDDSATTDSFDSPDDSD